jgi:hypothetical protein
VALKDLHRLSELVDVSDLDLRSYARSGVWFWRLGRYVGHGPDLRVVREKDPAEAAGPSWATSVSASLPESDCRYPTGRPHTRPSAC